PQLFPQSVVRTLCYIGRSNWAADGFLNGTIDDFRIYNRVLSDAELASLVTEQPEPLSIIADGGTLCAGNTVNLRIINSQPGVAYRLRNAQNLAFIGNAQNGTGDTLTFSSGALSTGITFEFVATSLISGCERIIAVPSNITVLPLPDAPTAINGSVCLSGEVTIGASSPVSNASYNWYLTPTGGAPISGNNTATFVTPQLNVSQDYYVSVVNANGCESPRSVVSAVVINPLNPPVDLVSDLILFYRMDGNITDESGNNINGTVLGGPSFYSSDRNGNENAALNIGVGAYVDAGNPAAFNALTNEVTISMWVRQTQSFFGSQTPLLNKWGGTGIYMALDGFNASNPQNPVRWRINGSTFLTSNTNVPLLQWHHIVCTYNGAQLRVYQNGVLTGTLNQTGNIPATGNNLQIGRQSNGLGAIDFRGDLDQVRVYSRALNQSEISTLFNNESVAFGPQAFCDGQSNVTLSTFNFPGATYQWTGPNGYSSNLQNPPVINNAVAGVHDGEYNLEVTVNGCTSDPQPVNVVINEFPDAPTTTDAFVCQSGFATLTASGAPEGGSYRWYTVPTSGTPISGQTGPTLVIPNVTATTSYYVSIIANGCEGPRAEVVAFLYLSLDLSLTTTADYSICYTEESITLQINNTQEGVQYTPLFGGQPFAETQTGPGNLQWEIPMSELVPGLYKFTFLAEQTGCLSGILTSITNVLIVGETTSSIKSSEGTSICEGTSTTLTVSLADSYVWSTGETTQTIVVSTSGTYSVTITALEDCIYTSEIEIDLIDLPDLVISAESAQICQGSGTTLSTAPQAGLFYQWYFNGEALSGVNSSMYFAVDEGTYQLQTFGDGCLNWSNEIVVSTIPIPTGFFNLEGPQVFCEETELFYSITGLENVDNYNWIITPEGAATLVSGQGTASGLVVPNADVFTIDVIPSNLGCVNTTYASTVSRTNPLNAPIEGPTVLDCANAIVTYSVPFNDEVSNYEWTLPAGALIISGEDTNVIEVAFGGAGGEISVVETTGTGCVGEIQTLIVECVVNAEELEKSASLISVYPNPMRDNLIIEVNNNELNSRGIRLEVLDISGRIIQTHWITNLRTTLSMDNLAQGTYILKIHTPTLRTFNVVKM
ncbi:MAG: LamG-like jellyroll fold domain-containing protein, partial [Flavobacteriales bacterium]